MKDNRGHGSNSGGGGSLGGGGGSALPTSQANFVQAMVGLQRDVAARMGGKSRTTISGEKQLAPGRGAVAHQSGVDRLRGDGNPGAAQGAYANVAASATAPGSPTGFYDPGPRVAENASAPRTGVRHYGLK